MFFFCSILAGYESVYSDDVEDIGDELTKTRQTREETVEKVEIRSSIYENLLDEMKKSELHYNSDTRNVQEKIDEISAEKSQKKDEPNEMQNKAQVFSSFINPRLVGGRVLPFSGLFSPDVALMKMWCWAFTKFV